MKNRCCVTVVAVLMMASVAMGQVAITWDNANDSGSYDYQVGGNWIGGTAPLYDDPIINTNLSGNRDINTGPYTGWTRHLQWTANGTYEDKLTLGGKYKPTVSPTLVNNGAVGDMVIDLNGERLELESNTTFPAMTFENSGGVGGEIWSTGSLVFNSAADVGADVEVYKEFGTINLLGGIWHPDSLLTFQGAHSGIEFTSYAAGTVGQLDVNMGTLGNVIPSAHGDVNIAVGGRIGIAGGTQLVKVGGNFTDLNTTGDYVYAGAGGRIRFEGASPTTHNVSIGRELSMTRFELEDDGTIILGNDLISTYALGFPESLAGARTTWDVGPHDLYISDMIMTADGVNAPTFIMEAGADTGTITFDEVIHGTDWNVIVENGGGFAFGSDLVLMTINDLDTGFGTNLPGVTLPGGWSYDSLDEIAIGTSGSIFQLTNVVPEPVSLVLLGLGSVALLRRRR